MVIPAPVSRLPAPGSGSLLILSGLVIVGCDPTGASRRHELYASPLVGAAKDEVLSPEAAREVLRTHAVQWGTEVGADGVERSLDGVFESPTEAGDVGEAAEPEVRPAELSEGVRALATEGGAGEVRVRVGLRRWAWQRGEQRSLTLMAAILEGRVMTEEDAEAVKVEWYDARRAAAEGAWASRAEALSRLGAVVESVGPVSAVAVLRLPAASVAALVNDPDIASVEVEGEYEEVDDAGHWQTVTGTTVTGWEAEDLLQTDTYYTSGYGGAGMIGLTESGAPTIYNSHPGFKDDSGSTRRLLLCDWNPSLELCTDSTPDPGSDHATAVASVLIGDITDGQDPDVPNMLHLREERSGVAREAWVRATAPGDQEAVFTHPTWGVDMVNRSSSVATPDPTCSGEGAAAELVNALFEAGVAYFKAAGNAGHSDPDNCTVGPPGAAIGAFPVGAWYVDNSDNEVIYSGSSRGGAGAEGRGRTVVGLVAPGFWQYPYAYSDELEDLDDNPLVYGTDWLDSSLPPPNEFCCTSSSTPAATGAANLFKQYFEAERGALDSPALLYTNLMLMGDRTVEDGSRTLGAPDNLWGMGKLRMRIFNSEWMDNPFAYATGTTCVDHGSSVTLNLGSSSLSSEVDVLRVVTWWYDSRHDSGVDNDQVALKVQYTDGSTTTVEAIQGGTDNRRRIHLDELTAGVQYQAVFTGTSVTSDEEGCGSNSMRVYYAWFYEDSTRQSYEALSPVRPE